MRKAQILVFGVALVTLFGCSQSEIDVAVEKIPRPVETDVLKLQPLVQRQIVTASAASWKSEEIEFEVSGRVEWVKKLNSNVEGRVVNELGEVLVVGDQIARIDPEKYELLEQKAKAEWEKAKQNSAAAKVEYELSLQAQLDAAKADLELAQIDLKRRIQLVERNAGAQADVDKANANLQNARSKIEQINSAILAKKSELDSLKLQIEIAFQAWTDAKRDLANCQLYSPFRGQITEVFAVSGTLVGAGTPVATVQLMHPIKLEFEVSAEDSRRLRQRRYVRVQLTLENGDVEWVDGEIFLIDSVADPQTQTFTVTVLARNEMLSAGGDLPDPELPSIEDVWPMRFDFLPSTKANVNFVVEECICEDGLGHFVWNIKNFGVGQEIPKNRILNVEKLRIKKRDLLLPFFGNWLFREVEILDDSIDINKTLIAGKLSLPTEEAKKWDGSSVRMRPKQNWKIRPGDIVKIDLSEKRPPVGLFVPMDAIVHHADRKFLVLLEDEANQVASVKRVEVNLLPKNESQPSSSLREIDPEIASKIVGRKYVTKGAHFLVEGEMVRVVNESSSSVVAKAKSGLAK